MDHKGTIKLETERLVLRRFTIDDVEDAFNNWMSDDKVTKFVTWPSHESVEVSRRVIEDWIYQYKKDNFYQWVIELKASQEIIGTITVVDMDESIDQVEIGYSIGSKYWGKGYTPEAFRAVQEFLFNQIGVNRIEARHDVNNPNSGRVMEKVGLKYEGRLRQAGLNQQGLADINVYSILKEEYYE